MKTAAIYCRVSTETQASEGTSLHSQKEANIVKAKELGYDVPGDLIFSEVWTGTDTDRPKLNSLRQMIKDKAIDAVVCYSTDRLARNPIHISIIAEECVRRGIELIFVTEPMDNSPEGWLIRYVKGYAAQVEHEKIRERTMRGKKQGVRNGKLSTGGTALFGYDQAEGKRTINEAEANIAKSIFHKLANEGYTLYKVVSDLNLASISAPRGGKWTEHTIHRLVNNPAYMGVTYAFRYVVVNKTHKLRDRAEWIEVPGVTPAIVSKETYELTQKQMELNRHRSPRNRKHDYLLSNGRLRCGVCGHSMVGSAKKKTNGYLRLYRCVCNMKPNYYDHCGQRSIAAHRIEPLVWNEISRILTQPDTVLAELDEQRKATKPLTLEADRLLVEGNIANARTEEQRYLRQYGKGLIDETGLEVEIRRVRKYREQQEANLVDIDEQISAYEQATASYQQFSEVIKVIADRLQNADHDLKRLALDALNIQATLQPDRTVAITGVIPDRVREVAETHHRPLWHHLG